VSQSPTQAVGRQQAGDYLAGLRRMKKLIEGGRSHSGHERNCCFLNTGARRFANVSAVSGLDFADDGRAVAPVDWDGDGDLDLWLANRTGPQLRFMRNDADSGGHFVAVRLVGRTVNRDGIGARVEVQLDGQDGGKLIQTLHAGQGYLTQASKWIHFGLGDATKIRRVVVRWPGGEAEEFQGMRADQRYRLTQGRGVAEILNRSEKRGVKLRPSTLAAPRSSQQMRIWLAARPPMPSLPYTHFDGRTAAVDVTRGPVLVNLWASWCAPCRKELREFSARSDDFKKRGISVVALSVDQLGDVTDGNVAEAHQFVQDLTVASGIATGEVVEKLELLYAELFQRRIEMPVPASFLVDGDGRLAAIYFGSIDLQRFLRDVEHLGAEPDELRAWSDPLPGRWSTPVGTLNLKALAHAYLKSDYLEDAIAPLQLAVSQTEDDVYTLHTLGTALLKLGKPDQGELYLRRAIAVDPRHATSQFNLGFVAFEREDLDEAVARFRTAVEIVPDFTNAHQYLAKALQQLGDTAAALEHFRRAWDLAPDHLPTAIGLSWLLATCSNDDLCRPKEAVQLAERARALAKSETPELLDTLAAAYASDGRFEEAVATAEKALTIALALPTAKTDEQSVLADQIEQRLRLYKQKKPFREPSKPEG